MTSTLSPPPAPTPTADISRAGQASTTRRRRSTAAGRPPAPPRPTFNQMWRALPLPLFTMTWALLTLSALALWAIAYVYVFSGIQQQRTNSVLYSQFRYQLAQGTAPLGGMVAPGSPVALIQGPIDGIRGVVVVEGTTSEDLTAGPGHRRDTPLPGQPGTSVIYGRSLTYGAPFGAIENLRRGQKFTVTTSQGAFIYVVEKVRHPGDTLPNTLQSGQSRVILQTAGGPAWAPNTTVFVDSLMQGDTVASPGGRLSGVLPTEKPMKGDSSHLLVVVLWLEALIVVAVGAVWARARWGKWQTWVITVPLLVTVLWETSNTLTLILPNLV